MKKAEHPRKNKTLRHDFTPEERNELGSELARQIAAVRGIEAEFDQIKASYKARTSEAAARVDSISTSLMNGFEMRDKRCVIVFRPKTRQKLFILEADFEKKGEKATPALVEEMTPEDFQADLLQAESVFEKREEIPLFVPAEKDFGIVIVGRCKPDGAKAPLWFAALRIQIGAAKLEERLDTEQPSAKKRFDILQRAAKRAGQWMAETLGDAAALGFVEPIQKAIEAQKEREE